MKQKYTSAKSSIKQIPAGYKIVDKHYGWKEGTVNLDIGGGKYDLFTDKLREHKVINFVYDPYNRTEQHNKAVLTVCRNIPPETITIFNVLNVIEEFEMQINVLNLALETIKNGGNVYIRSVYKNPNKVSGVTKSGTYQHYKTQREYLEIVKKVFPDAKLEYGIISITISVCLPILKLEECNNAQNRTLRNTGKY